MDRISHLVKKFKSGCSSYCKKNKCTVHDLCIDFTLKQCNLSDALRVAALSCDKDGKRHPHQYRITTWNPLSREMLAEALAMKYKEINKAIDFDELLNILKSIKIRGIGELTNYDVALRIGMYKGMLPQKIYLHAGTREGAKNILKKKRLSRQFITKDELPEPLQNLECWQIEDFLCHFKNDF